MRALLCALALAACGQPGEPAAGAGSAVRLFSESEITTWETALLQRLAANPQRSCNAPRVSDAAAVGPLGPDLVALVEPTGDLGACGVRIAGAVTAPDGVEALRDRRRPVLELLSDCRGAIEAHLDAEAAHVLGCSPYQLGVRAEPESLSGVLHLARFVALDAALGDPWRGMQLIVEYTRALQDLTRGHVTLIATMIAVAGTRLVTEPAAAILATRKLSPAQLAQLATELDALIDAIPSFADTLAGERDMTELSSAMGALMPAGWTPPGGWPPGAMHGKQAAGSDDFADPRDIAAIMFAVAESTAKQNADACPPAATFEACTAGLVKLAAAQHGDPESTKTQLAALWNDGVRAKLAGNPVDAGEIRAKIRHAMLETMTSIAVPELDAYPRKASATFVRLIALRLQVEALRIGHCPTAAELATAQYASLLAPTRLGSPVVVTPRAQGMEVAAPAWMGSAVEPIAVPCP